MCKQTSIILGVFDKGIEEMQMDYLINGLADYVSRLKYEDLTERSIEVAKQVITDSYANMVFGRYCEASEKIMSYAYMMEINIKNETPVLLLGQNKEYTGLDTAVFVHTMMARCADLDDGYRHAMGHPGSVLVPLLLTIANQEQISGKEMITAIVAAYDIYARLGEALNPFMYREKGFDATGVCGAVAAAALACKIKKLSMTQTKDAMGIASLFTGGLIEYQNDGTSGKILCSGWAALTGLRAVRLAICGFSGPNAALEGRYGFFQAFQGTSGYCDTTSVLKDLGTDFKINRIYFKRHACQRGLHALLDGIVDLRAQHGLRPAIIRSIQIYTSSFVYRLSNPNPSTAVGAQASTQFTTAVALKYGKMDSEELVFKSFTDPEIHELVKKVEVIKDDEVQSYLDHHPTHFCAAKIVITTVEGNQYESWNPVPLGDEETPFGWDMLRDKFESLFNHSPAKDSKVSVQARFELLRHFEEISTSSQLNEIESLFVL